MTECVIQDNTNTSAGDSRPKKVDLKIGKEAKLALLKFNFNIGAISMEEVNAALREKNVIHGVRYAAIERILNSKQGGEFFICAKATAPVDGIDSWVDYLIIEKKGPKQTKDGGVDHYDIQSFTEIEEGEPLAKKNPPTEGKAGKTVTGEEISAKPGEDRGWDKIIGGDGVVVDPEDPDTLKAARSGVYYRLGATVDVKNDLMVNRSIDFAVGNINTAANVTIHGDVMPGFKVISKQNVFITGVVENATVQAGKNIRIDKGIIKGEEPIIAGGKLTSNYIAGRVGIEANDVVVKNLIQSSFLSVKNNLKAKKIVGGRIVAGNKIVAEEIGNKNSSPTFLELGVNSFLLSKLKEHSDQVSILKGQLNKINETLYETEVNFEEAKDKLETKLFHSRTKVPDQILGRLEELVRSLKSEVQRQKNNRTVIQKKLKYKLSEIEKITPELVVDNPEIRVSGVLFQNVTIKMGLMTRITTKKPRRSIVIKLSDDGKLEYTPYTSEPAPSDKKVESETEKKENVIGADVKITIKDSSKVNKN